MVLALIPFITFIRVMVFFRYVYRVKKSRAVGVLRAPSQVDAPSLIIVVVFFALFLGAAGISGGCCAVGGANFGVPDLAA